MMVYEVHLINTFEGDSAEESVSQMLEWIHSTNLNETGFTVIDEDGDKYFIDAEDIPFMRKEDYGT